MNAKKTEKELNDELINAAVVAIQSYEAYLMDRIGWRELARVMDTLRKTVLAIDKDKLSK